MGIHANAKLGPAGRRELARLIVEDGLSEREAAQRLAVSPATAHRWKRRRVQATEDELQTGAWALDRPSRPFCSPAQTAPELERRVCAERQRTGWGPRLIAGTLGLPHSTVHAVLKRHNLSRRPPGERRQFCRYEWPCPGDLVHVDVKKYPRFVRPGHAVTGDRSKTAAEKNAPLGHDFFHAMVDDHSRLVGSLEGRIERYRAAFRK
jgi:transposase